MKNYSIKSILLILSIILTACSNDDSANDNPPGNGGNSKNSKVVTLSEATMDNVSVLIFGRNNINYTYQRSIDKGWSEDGKVTTFLEIGSYKFLFLKNGGLYTDLYPKLLKNAKFEDIRIDAKKDPARTGYMLAVDEIWLPETEEMAARTYVIKDSTTIPNKLKRAVSQVELRIQRGGKEGEKMVPQPYPAGENIMENIKEVRMDISGVGESISIYGAEGMSKTMYVSQEEDLITDEGFARFDGPFVFPNGTGDKTSVDITIVPIDDTLFPETTTTVEGLLERNKKLEITLWMTSTSNFITITVKTEDISGSEDGDTGIWE